MSSANPDVQVGFDNAEPGDCFTNTDELITLLNRLIHGELVGDFTPYVISQATPAVEDQNKVWHRQDNNGKPIGTYLFFNGRWRKEYNHNLNEIVMYSGDPAIDFAEEGHKGTIGGDWDGFQLCSGENGSPNLSNQFIVGAKMDDLAQGYPNGSGPWTTTVDGTSQQSGGSKDITLDSDHTFQPPVEEVKVGQWTANTNTPGISLYGLPNGAGDVILQPHSDGRPNPTAIPTLPPYYALAYAIFVGY